MKVFFMIHLALKTGLLFLLCLPTTASAGCRRLTIYVQDYATHQPLLARLSYKNLDAILPLGTTKSPNGSFSFDADCSAMTLIVEKEGYRPQHLRLNLDDLPKTGQPFPVIIPLFPVDQQARDQPYSQTQQTHYVQSSDKKSSTASQKSVFTIMDALTNSPLQSEACFFFTKKPGKTCFEIGTQNQPEIKFTEKDIVALEVSAAGYQTYRGNIIIEKLANQTIRHTIRLQRELTVLAVQMATSITGLQCELRPETSEKISRASAIPGTPGQFCAFDLALQSYQLVLIDPMGTIRHQQPVSLQQGLNVVQIPDRVTDEVLKDSTELRLPDRIPAIYFLQSSYELRPESKKVLQKVVQFLQQHPNYNVRVQGHTDNVGSERQNFILSEFRAQVAANFLINLGVGDHRLYKTGMGSKQPTALNDTEENRAKNRRVTLELVHH